MVLQQEVIVNIKIKFLNNKCIRHSVNGFQSKNHRIETYGINKISLSYYDEKNIYPNIYPKQWIS